METENSNALVLNEVLAAKYDGDQVASLQRLVELAATSSCRGANVAAQLLLGLYDGSVYPFDLTELSLLDDELFEDALNALRLRMRHSVEPHLFFANGGALFNSIAEAWHLKPETSDQGGLLFNE